MYPLASKVADADNRAARADRALREARREFDAAKGVATSQQRAEAELKTFYGEVLPADLSAAQRVTYLTLAQLARTNNLRIVRRTGDEGHNRGSRLDYLRVALFLEGQYEDVRDFVHAIEISRDFVIIDDVELDQARDGQAGLDAEDAAVHLLPGFDRWRLRPPVGQIVLLGALLLVLAAVMLLQPARDGRVARRREPSRLPRRSPRGRPRRAIGRSRPLLCAWRS